MVNSLNTKISLRKDDLSNWISADPILLDGELVVAVDENGENLIKIGNGISTFIQLPYLYQNHFDSKQVSVKSLSQGFNVKSTPTSMATGVFSKADANFGVVHGIEAEIKEGDDYSFVFNGNNLPLDGKNFYKSHGEGTFNVNPKDGLSGFYVGDAQLAEILSRYDNSSAVDKKIIIDGVSADSLCAYHIGTEEYYQKVVDGKVLSNELYIVSSDYMNAYGQQIKNVAEPELSDDAATKGYADDEIIKISAQVSSDYVSKDAVIPEAGITKIATIGGKDIMIPKTDLSEYYKKTDTSSAIEIQNAIDAIPLNDLSSQVNPAESDVTASGEYYRVYADKMNNLTSVQDHMKIVLDSYDFSKSYVMKFNTPQNNEIHFDFYVDNGSGPQFDSEMNINKSYSFPMNSGYVIEVKFDAMDIRPLAWNGDRQKMIFRTVEWVED